MLDLAGVVGLCLFPWSVSLLRSIPFSTKKEGACLVALSGESSPPLTLIGRVSARLTDSFTGDKTTWLKKTTSMDARLLLE